MSKYVLVIEDDRIQAEELARRLRNPEREVRIISTELDFRSRLSQFDHSNCPAAIVDMMLRWTDPAPDMTMPPDEILQEGFYTAGLRCCRELRRKGIPSVIFTALDPARVPLRQGESFPIINKSRGFDALLEEVRPLLA